MGTRAFALLIATILGLAALVGLVPGALWPAPAGAPDLLVRQGYGYLLRVFPVNILLNLVHLLFAVLGVSAFSGAMPTLRFCRMLAIAYGLLAIAGLIPGTRTLFGLMPVYGADVALHGVIAIAATYYGLIAVRATEITPV